ncbi:hypothetical protein H0H93_014641 [Arthromyces matolae]|nr:hypothetical protein H0H93_014641 [Arthromyces matolae]
MSAQMHPFVNPLNRPALISGHVSSGQNSLQGALKSASEPMIRPTSTSSKSPNGSVEAAAPTLNGHAKALVSKEISSSLDQDMQRQLADYNRSITIVVWYRAGTEAIRLQHMNPTFPYFQLQQLEMLVTDLALTPTSFIDTYDPQSGTWEQHNITTVRLVGTQQRLLYKTRRSLLDGLNENDCPSLHEEVSAQASGQFPVSAPPKSEQTPTSTATTLRKRSAAAEPPPERPQKVHIPNHYYSTLVPTRSDSHMSTHIPASSSVIHVNGAYPSYQPQAYYPTPAQQVAPTVDTNSSPVHAPSVPVHALPPAEASISDSPPPHSDSSPSPQLSHQAPTSTSSVAPIPHHPHPPLKRWPNDYTVSEITNGFRHMETLVRDSSGRGGTGGGITQRAAFERVFGSRYVKSTVCRHRGLWRKAAGTLREQFEMMGSDERACWGEFVRRVEGRPPKTAQNQMQIDVIPPYRSHTDTPLTIGAETRPPATVQSPVMASLQNPDVQAPTGFR